MLMKNVANGKGAKVLANKKPKPNRATAPIAPPKATDKIFNNVSTKFLLSKWEIKGKHKWQRLQREIDNKQTQAKICGLFIVNFRKTELCQLKSNCFFF